VTTRPLPSIEGPDEPFWLGLRQREVRVQRCGDCGTCRFPAVRLCEHCRSENFEWVAVDPTGIIETWCVFHRQYFEGLTVPYTVIQVRLKCGIRLFSNPVGIKTDALCIDMPVKGVFEDVTPDVTLLKFQPTKGDL
jgi:uncharacterized OB-fold protein